MTDIVSKDSDATLASEKANVASQEVEEAHRTVTEKPDDEAAEELDEDNAK